MLSSNAYRFSITFFALLATCFVLLTLTSALSISVISHRNVSSGTRELLRQKSEVVTQAIFERVVAHRDSAEALATGIAGLLSKDAHLSVESPGLSELFRAALTGTPHISTIGLVDDKYRMRRVFRTPRPGAKSLVRWGDDPGFVSMIRQGTSQGNPSWGSLFFSEFSQTTFVNYLHPIKGTVYSLLLSISINDLSDYLRRIEKEAIGHLFILFDEDRVLAHPKMISGYTGLSDNRPLPLLGRFADPVLRSIWSGRRLPDLEPWFTNALSVRVTEIDGRPYVFLFRMLPGYGAKFLRVGTYFALDEVAPQIQRNKAIIFAFAGLMVLTLSVALVLSRLVSRPVKNITKAAEQISQLHLDERATLPESHISEMNELTAALRSMIAGLRSFERYVPAQLVHHVMRDNEAGDIKAEEKMVTVLFTDIVGFTGIAETMDAPSVVSMLNEHFEIIDGCIEAEGGTIDKYMGDSVMAFWGGMETDDDQAIHACAAALRIERAVCRNNTLRLANGDHAIHVRVGIHTGLAMVGNIGASARISYTLVGDTVNIAARLEEFSREVEDSAIEALTVISGEVASRVGREFTLRDVGEITLRGRHEATKVYRLMEGHQAENLSRLDT